MGHSSLDVVVVPFFRVLLNLFNLVQSFAPIDALSTGRSIPPEMLARAILTIVVQPPTDADRLKKNPLGLYVHALNWSKELG